MKKLLILILCCLVGGVKAQVPCEFDSIYTHKKNEAGHQILECKTGGFMIFQLNGFASSVHIPNPEILLTKTDNCGNRLWTQRLDSTRCSGTGGTCANLLDLFEVENGNIECAGYINDKPEKSGIWIYKADSNGFLLNKVKLDLDSNLYYRMNNFIKINTNRYLFTGSIGFVATKPIAYAVMADASGKIISKNRFYVDSTLQSGIYKTYLINSNELMLLGYEGSVLKIIKTDSTLNITSLMEVPFPNAPIAILNYDSSLIYALYFLSSTSSGYSYVINKLNLKGEIINSREFTIKLTCGLIDIGANTISNIRSLPENRLSLNLCNFILILDSALNIVKMDSFAYSIQHTTLTKDNGIASTGYIASGSPTSLFVQFALNKTNLVTFVKSLVIFGQGTINQQFGSLQFNAIVSPTTAANKTVIWSISDSSKASIAQTGLLTAKANGIVTVTAKTTDGSDLAASKQITITNQGVGLLKNDLLDSQIEIFPNPATTHVSILSNDLKIQLVQLIDIQGKKINTFNNPEHIYLNSFTNGCFFLKIETDKGTVFKKLVINK